MLTAKNVQFLCSRPPTSINQTTHLELVFCKSWRGGRRHKALAGTTPAAFHTPFTVLKLSVVGKLHCYRCHRELV